MATVPEFLQQNLSFIFIAFFVNGQVQVKILSIVFCEDYPVACQPSMCSFLEALNHKTVCKVVWPKVRTFAVILDDLIKQFCEVSISTIVKIPTHAYISWEVSCQKEMLVPERM